MNKMLFLRMFFNSFKQLAWPDPIPPSHIPHPTHPTIPELFPNFSVERIAKTLPFKNQAFHNLFVDAMKKAGLPE
jgi:hypothetical protein